MKKVNIFSQTNLFVYFRELSFLAQDYTISEGNFWGSKNSEPEKISYILGKGTF